MYDKLSSETLPATYVEGFHDLQEVRKMTYRRLGNTGLYVSYVGLGGGALSGYYGTFDETAAIEMIVQAIKMGVNYIDTAPWYGQGRSEEVLGKALRNVPRKAYYLGTKVGRYETDVRKMFDFSAEKTKSSAEHSLQLLQLDYVDIIQIHDVEFAASEDLILKETLPTLLDVKAAGKARFIGVTGYSLTVMQNIISKADGKINTVLSYCRNTLFDETLDEFLDFFKSLDIGVIDAAAHGMGLLTNNGPQSWHPAPDDLKETCKEAANYCKSRNLELGNLAMYHSHKTERSATCIVGMQNLSQLEANLNHLLLNSQEEKVLKEIRELYFSKLPARSHWEGKEVDDYWKKITDLEKSEKS